MPARDTVLGTHKPAVEIVYERVAAIDVGKKMIAVAVRTLGNALGSVASSYASTTPSIRR